jgi:hypothetical protein
LGIIIKTEMSWSWSEGLISNHSHHLAAPVTVAIFRNAAGPAEAGIRQEGYGRSVRHFLGHGDLSVVRIIFHFSLFYFNPLWAPKSTSIFT